MFDSIFPSWREHLSTLYVLQYNAADKKFKRTYDFDNTTSLTYHGSVLSFLETFHQQRLNEFQQTSSFLYNTFIIIIHILYALNMLGYKNLLFNLVNSSMKQVYNEKREEIKQCFTLDGDLSVLRKGIVSRSPNETSTLLNMYNNLNRFDQKTIRFAMGLLLDFYMPCEIFRENAVGLIILDGFILNWLEKMRINSKNIVETLCDVSMLLHLILYDSRARAKSPYSIIR